MFGRSRASREVIDQDASITHRRSQPQLALSILRDSSRDAKPRSENWKPAKMRSLGKAGWNPARIGKSREQRGLMSDDDIIAAFENDYRR